MNKLKIEYIDIDKLIPYINNPRINDAEDVVLDTFGGSGTTLIACEQNGRNAYLMELDPKYVDVIVNRYIKLVETDEEVFLIRDGEKIPYNKVK